MGENMGDYLAIFIAMGSFFFTMYQYWLTMYFRRPHLRLVRFNPDNILLNNDYKDFIIYPRMNFVLVNMSDIANSLLDMKVYCYIGGKWHEGTVQGSQELLPIFVAGHASEIATKGRGLAFSFPVFPTREEVKNAKILVELYDQYDRVYKIRLDSKWIEKASFTIIPWTDKNEKYLAEVRYQAPDSKEPDVYHLIYNFQNPERPYIESTSFNRYGHGHGGSYFTAEAVKRAMAESQETRILYTNNIIGQSKLYFIREADGKVKSMEVEIPGKPVMKVEMPAEFVTAIENFKIE